MTKKVLQIDPKYAQAQYNYGVMLEKGRGLVANIEESAAWYAKAALAGDAKAQFNLGVLYYEGRGVQGDLRRAKELYTMAAQQGHEDAHYNLSLMQN
jgi:TPR repeat protein